MSQPPEPQRRLPLPDLSRLFRLGPEWLAVIVVVPVLAAGVGAQLQLGGVEYVRWWGSWRGWQILGQTLGFAGVAALVAVGAGGVVASAAARAGQKGTPALLGLALLPLTLPSSLVGTAWIMALGRDGVITTLLAEVGVPPHLTIYLTIYEWPIAAAVVGLRYTGIAALMLWPEMRRQAVVRERAEVLGMRGLWAWWSLRGCPALRPAAAAGALLLVLIMNEPILPGMFLIQTYATQLLIQYNALMDPAGAVALALPVLGVGLLAAIGGVWLGWETWTAPGFGRPQRGSAVRLMAAALVLGLALGLPVAALAVKAGTWTALRDAAVTAAPELRRTLQLVGVAAVSCAMLGSVLAAGWLRSRQARRPTLVPLTLINLAAPAPLLAAGIVELSDRWPLRSLRDGDLPLLLGYVVRFVPLLVLVLFVAWSRHPPAPDHAARVMGVTHWRRRWQVVWPQRRSALALAAVMVGLLVAAELELSVLLIRPGTTTLGVRLYTMIHTAPDELVAALALDVLILIVGCLTLLLAAASLPRWLRRRYG